MKGADRCSGDWKEKTRKSMSSSLYTQTDKVRKIVRMHTWKTNGIKKFDSIINDSRALVVPHFDNTSECKAFSLGTNSIIWTVSDMEECKIPAFRFKQKDYFFYSFVENSKTLRKMVYALPKSRDSPEQLQRALSLSRIEDIWDKSGTNQSE